MASSKKWRKKGKRNTKFKKKREGRPLMPNKDKDTKKQMMKWKFNSTTTNAQKFIIFASFQFVKFFFIRNWHYWYRYIGNTIYSTEFSYGLFSFDVLWLHMIYCLNLPTTTILQPGRVVRDWLCMRTNFTVSWVWVTSLA